MKVTFIVILSIFSISYNFGQKQNNIWYFGRHAGLDFNTSPPTPIKGKMEAIEGCSSVSDQFGKLLFYSDGITIWDRNHNVMPNGTGLLGGFSSTQAALIVPLPNSNSIYYAFCTEDQFTDGGLRYSIINMNLNGGFGDVEIDTKNTEVVDSTTEQVTAILAANLIDIWIITHKRGTDEFLCYLLTPDGFNSNPVISKIGAVFPAEGSQGPLKSSHNGTKLVSSLYNCCININDMFDFDASTGTISNYFDLNQLFSKNQRSYGIEFSPNDSLLYLVSQYFKNNLYQLNLATNSLVDLGLKVHYHSYCALQLAPDGQIYMASYLNDTLNIIHQPNKLGVGCQFEEDAILLSDSTISLFGLPNQAPYSLFSDDNDSFSLGNDTSICLGNSFVIEPKLPLNCFAIDYLWNNGSQNASLNVNETGDYWVEINSTCGKLKDTIHVKVTPCVPIVYYDLEACSAYMSNGSNMDYSEFVPAYPNVVNCAELKASNVFRQPPQENKHSCTSGIGNSIAMCISSFDSCVYIPGNKTSLIFEMTIVPDSNSRFRLTGLEFYQRAPEYYNWINGGSGLNNFPLEFGIRILKNGTEIFKNESISTTADWSLQTFNFLQNSLFEIHDSSLIRIELLPYCLIDNGAEVSAWDIDEIKVFGGCQTNNFITHIQGKVKTAKGQPLTGVAIQLSGDSTFSYTNRCTTDVTGIYSFDQPVEECPFYVRGYKNDDPLNGVSTLDLLLIQKHLLGILPFQTLTEFIAADVNNNGVVNVLDLLDLKKLILGIYTKYPNNTSWRFVTLPQSFELTDLSKFKEFGDFNCEIKDTIIQDFTGIKIGDINGDTNIKPSVPIDETKNINQIGLLISDQKSEDGKSIFREFKLDTTMNLSGIQIPINIAEMDLVSINGQTIPLTEEDYFIQDSVLIICWISDRAISLRPNDILFTLTLNSNQKRIDGNKLLLNIGNIKPELYSENMNILPIKQLSFGNLVKIDNLNQFYIYPNPVPSFAFVHFSVRVQSKIMIELCDISGRCLYHEGWNCSPGNYDMKINLPNTINNGIYFCRFSSNEMSITKSFIKTN